MHAPQELAVVLFQLAGQLIHQLRARGAIVRPVVVVSHALLLHTAHATVLGGEALRAPALALAPLLILLFAKTVRDGQRQHRQGAQRKLMGTGTHRQAQVSLRADRHAVTGRRGTGTRDSTATDSHRDRHAETGTQTGK